MNLEGVGKQAAAVVSIVTVLGFMAFAFNYVQTDAEAQQYQAQHASELVRFRVQQIEAQISQYRYQLLSTDLTPQQREWITAEIARLEAQKRCINSGGTC